MCSSDIQCESNQCSDEAYCLKQSCEVLGGFDGPFDQETIVLVFVGSGFTDMNRWDTIVKKNFNKMQDYDIFNDKKAKYKALYVKEPTAVKFCNYGCHGVERLLCCDQSIAKGLTDKCFPKRNTMQTIVIHDDDRYGGAGYREENMAVTSTNVDLGPTLLLHEIGHSLFNFGDEYHGSDATSETHPNCDVEGCPKVSLLLHSVFLYFNCSQINMDMCQKKLMRTLFG